MDQAPFKAPPSSTGPPPEATGTSASQPAAPIKRRATIACRRCRRMRSKCIHEKGQPPCKACSEANLAAWECVFPVRGQPDLDRDFRHPRVKGEKAQKRELAKAAASLKANRLTIQDGDLLLSGEDRLEQEWKLLPPLPDIVQAVNRFTHYYFQLGFIPKALFPNRLERNPRSVSVFLLLSILSISARFTPAIAQSYGGGVQAAERFMKRASSLAMRELYEEPTLERCQAFYLLSVAQQGSGSMNKSYINMGIAVRMALRLRLYREETYSLSTTSPELIVRAESARRTFWMLHSQENLHSAPQSPVSLQSTDITTLLPSSEEDFAQGRLPKSRAAMEGTPPALKDPMLVHDPERSLFASLMQAHHYWGNVARKAVAGQSSAKPWEADSDFAQVKMKLFYWEKNLPAEHKWSPAVLKDNRQKRTDLAYLGVTMIPRLSHIVVRKAYLSKMMRMPAGAQGVLRGFWRNMATELFTNVRELFEQIDAQFTDQSPEESVGAQMAAFCVYSCAQHLSYLYKHPTLCPETDYRSDALRMLHRTLEILDEMKNVWPLASHWVEGLSSFLGGTVLPEGNMAEGPHPTPQVLQPPVSLSPTLPKSHIDSRRQNSAKPPPPLPRDASNSASPQILPRPFVQTPATAKSFDPPPVEFRPPMISLPYPEPADRLPRISLPEGTTGGESMAPVGSCVSATTEPNGSSSSASETPQPPPPPARTSSFSTTNTRTATPATSRQPGAPPSLTQSLAQQLAQSPQTGPYIPVSSLIKPDAIYLGPTANPSLPAFDAAGTDWKPPPPLPGARKIVRKASTVDGTPAPVMVPGTGSPTNTGTPQGHRRRPSKRATVSGVVVPDAVAAAAATKVPGGLQRTPTFPMAPTSAAATTSPTTTLHALPTPTLPLSVQTLTTAAAPATGPPTPATPPLPPPHPALLAAAAAVPPPPYLYYLQHQAPAGATPAASRQYSGLSADGYEGALSEFLVGGMLPATALDLGGGGGSGWMFSGASEDSGQPQQQQAYNPQGIFGVAGTTGTAAAAMAAEAGGPSGPGGDGGFAGAAAPLAWQ